MIKNRLDGGAHYGSAEIIPTASFLSTFFPPSPPAFSLLHFLSSEAAGDIFVSGIRRRSLFTAGR